MRNSILLAMVFCLCGAVSFAAMTSEFVVNSITKYGITKTATVAVDATTPVMYQMDAAGGFVYLNTVVAGKGFPVIANTKYTLQPASGTTALVFTCTSTSAASGAGVYVAK